MVVVTATKPVEYVFHVPGGTFTDWCLTKPGIGSWVPCEECHYVVVGERADGSFDCVFHPKEDDIAEAVLDASVSHLEAMRRAHAIATDPAAIADVLAKHGVAK